MALKVTVATLDDVQEEYRSLYTEVDDIFVLNVEGVDDHPEVKGLKGAYAAVKAKRDELSGKVGEMSNRLKELEAKPNPTAKDDAEIIKLREALEAERDEWKGKAGNLEKQVFSLTVENGLESILSEVGVSDAMHRKAAKRLLLDDAKVIDGKAVVETDMGPVPLTDYAKRFFAGEGKSFVTKPTGGGASGSEGGTNAKSMKRGDFEALPPEQRAAVIKDGTAITD
jgi:hypothetical protein